MSKKQVSSISETTIPYGMVELVSFPSGNYTPSNSYNSYYRESGVRVQMWSQEGRCVTFKNTPSGRKKAFKLFHEVQSWTRKIESLAGEDKYLSIPEAPCLLGELTTADALAIVCGLSGVSAARVEEVREAINKGRVSSFKSVPRTDLEIIMSDTAKYMRGGLSGLCA